MVPARAAFARRSPRRVVFHAASCHAGAGLRDRDDRVPPPPGVEPLNSRTPRPTKHGTTAGAATAPPPVAAAAATIDTTSERPGGWLAAGLALSLVLLLAHSKVYAFLTDDAFISFRYARNLAHGFGLVFNPGLERVEGYSNFLWVVLLAAFDRLGLVPERVANVLSFTATAGLWAVVTAFVLRRRPVHRPWLVLVAPLVLASMRTVAVWATSGLETRLFEWFVVAGALRLVTEVETLAGGLRPRARAGWLFALGALTRPDGILFGGVALGLAAIVVARRRRPEFGWLVANVLPFAALVIAQFAFRHAYYGAWWPNTYYAKAAGRVAWGPGLQYVAAFVLEYALWLWVPLLVLGGLRLRETGRGFMALLFAVLIVPHALWIASIGGDHFEYRPFDLYVPLLAILLYEGAVRASKRMPVAGLAALLAGILVFNLALATASHRDFPRRHIPGFPGSVVSQPTGARFLDPARNPIYRWPGLSAIARLHRDLLRRLSVQFVGVRQEEHRMFLDLVRPEGRELQGLVARGILPPDTYIAIDCIGAIPYESDLRVLDRLGLTDAAVAHSAPGPDHVLAHEKRATSTYAAQRGVDFWATNRVHLLFPATDTWPLEAAGEGQGFWAANCGDGSWIVTQLPLGMAATAPRFPHLKFVTSFDPTFVPGYLANGIAMLQDSVARAPNPAARFQLASYLLFASRIPEALPQLGRCAEDTPDNPRVWYYLGVAHLKLGQAPLAVTDLGRALELAKTGGLADFVPQVEALLQQARGSTPPAVARPGS